MIQIVAAAVVLTVAVTLVSMLYARALRMAGDPARAADLTPAQRRLARLLATMGGVGRLPYGPGTWGSLATIPLAWVVHGLGGFPLFALATAVVFLAGLWAAAAHAPDADPPEVVIDEAAGMMLALWPLSLGLWMGGAAPWAFPWPGWLLAFALFRAFDILKPWPLSRLDALPGAWGVMLDDLGAGIIAGLLSALAAAAAHGWL